MGDSRGRSAAAEVEVWLRGGGRVVAASERAARAMAEYYHRARRAEGLTAWPAPTVESWSQFLRSTWESHAGSDDRLVLSPAQEQALWLQIIAESPQGRYLLAGPLERMAKMAFEAHGLLCAYAPAMLKESARSNWQQDHGAFSNWLSEFDRRCAPARVLSAARLPLQLIPLLESSRDQRDEVLLGGFDRLQPVQSMLLKQWGAWRQVETGETASQRVYYAAADEQSELNAAARWCGQKLKANKDARLIIVSQSLPKRRGEFERVFQAELGLAAGVEFSLGVPLAKIPLIQASYLLLRWLTGPIKEHELDWLLGCGFAVTGRPETFALTGFMRALRRRGMQRTQWRCDEFLSLKTGTELPAAWLARMSAATRSVLEAGKTIQSPMTWAEFVPKLLQQAGWPGERALSSEEFQALRRWQHALDVCASLGFDGRRVMWTEFLQLLDRTLNDALFAPESQDASVVITGPAESAGLETDAIWFMGASEDAWPGKASLHPLLPFAVQRDSGMPHGTAKLDLNLAESVTQRLMGSAQEICFSYPRQVDGVEMRMSRVVERHAGSAQELPKELTYRENCTASLETIEDSSCIPLADKSIAGGSAVLSAQSQCPFKAFASGRLRAESWEPAQAGLSAMQRGELLHEVLHSVWGEQGIRSLKQLRQIPDLESFVEGHVCAVLEREMPAGVRMRMPREYLALEEKRLVRVIAEWLRFESTRAEFTIAETEVDKEVSVAGLSLHLRLDRIDRLTNGKLLVIDYKTGNVSPGAWQLPRPEDVQMPLYAGFALGDGNEPGGLVFAKVRSGEYEFAGCVEDAVATLIPSGIKRTALARSPLTKEQLSDWRDYVEKMAGDFVAGHADVDPISFQNICTKCNFHTLCRVQEMEMEDESGEVADND